jgi:hypothetical protein
MAAHAACADAALADDRHWDAVAGANPQPEEAGEPTSGPPKAERRSGCLTVGVIVLLSALLVLSQALVAA